MTVRIIIGDSLELLKTLPAESVHCCVTSPPYWGLRDYGTGEWDGGEAGCAHRVGRQVEDSKAPGAITTGQRPGVDASVCRECGARRIDKQLGLEASPAEYVARMVEVFREIRRVLRSDGTLWLNIGDSYATGAGKASSPGGGAQGARFLESGPSGYRGTREGDPKNPGAQPGMYQPNRMPIAGLKPKDLCGIPWRLAFALQADGWYLRQDIIWAKPNPMPESVRDRCTKAHEYLFLLAKSERYYFDAQAIAEESIYKAGEGGHQRFGAPGGKAEIEYGQQVSWEIWQSKGTRNKRSVWTVATAPFSEAHFATFPPALIEPCVLAGCPVGGTVLDPFGGAGTTGLVADRHGRDAILIELNPEYADMARRRIAADSPLFAEVA